MFRSLFALATVLVGAAVMLVAAWPQLFGLAQAPVIAQLVALRGAALVVVLFGVAALVVLALVVPRSRRFAAVLSVMLLAFCAINAAVLSTRGFGNASFEPPAPGSAAPDEVTVLSWNTQGGVPGAAAIAQLGLDNGATIIALPETTNATGLAVAKIMAAAGHPMWVYTVAYDQVSMARSTTLLVSSALGEYDVDTEATTTSVLPTVIATPQKGSGPTIIAVHAVSPISGEMSNWRNDLRYLAGTCTGKNVIMAGDFNSTLDHYAGLGSGSTALGACSDAALASQNAAVGTWPTRLPALLGAPIDHVMATPNWRVTGMRVIQTEDRAGSDHRPIVAQLRQNR